MQPTAFRTDAELPVALSRGCQEHCAAGGARGDDCGTPVDHVARRSERAANKAFLPGSFWVVD